MGAGGGRAGEPEPTVASGVPAHWKQVFADDFDAATLDRSVWQPDRSGEKAGVPFNTDIEDGWFSPANVSVADGSLVFTIGSDDRTIHERTYGYSSGMVQSNAAIPLTPSRYVEARIRFPKCDGCWPAFWLHPLDRWPPEVDIAEYLESGTKSRPGFNYFDADGKKIGLREYGQRGVDYRDEFHTYGVLWEGDRLVPYLDGVALPRADRDPEHHARPDDDHAQPVGARRLRHRARAEDARRLGPGVVAPGAVVLRRRIRVSGCPGTATLPRDDGHPREGALDRRARP